MVTGAIVSSVMATGAMVSVIMARAAMMSGRYGERVIW